MSTTLKTVLTIAGSDPSGGAGIQADLRTFDRLGVRGLSAVTVITAQSEEKFYSLFPVPSNVLADQLSSISEGRKIDAVKIGMVGTTANVLAIVKFLKKCEGRPVVVDPIFFSSTGYRFLPTEVLPMFELELLPLATVITPNIPEAEKLAKVKITDLKSLRESAKILHDRFGKGRDFYVLVKGGHLSEGAIDSVYDGTNFFEISGERINVSLHGSGCLYSSAVATHMAFGSSVVEAAKAAKLLVTEEFKKSVCRNRGP